MVVTVLLHAQLLALLALLALATAKKAHLARALTTLLLASSSVTGHSTAAVAALSRGGEGRGSNETCGYVLNIRDYYTPSPMPHVSPLTSTTYEARQLAPNIDSALDAAIAEAARRVAAGSGVAYVYLPAGLYTLAREHNVPSGVTIRGDGYEFDAGATHLRRIGDYGHTFIFGRLPFVPGDAVGDAGIEDVRIYQDHGAEQAWGFDFPIWPLTPGPFLNRATNGAHLYFAFPRACHVDRVSLWGHTTGLHVLGGASSTFTRIDITQIWDITNPAHQEGMDGIVIDGDPSTSGALLQC